MPRRVLMSLDAIGGVWRYGMDLARGLSAQDVSVVFACLGPAPSPAQIAEARSIGTLVRLDAPLDWLAGSASELRNVGRDLQRLAEREGCDLLHLNLPSQAAGLETELPVVVVSHSCVPSWFATVRGTDVPADWAWQVELNRRGFKRADVAIAPSRSHADVLERCYGNIPSLRVCHNAVRPLPAATGGRRVALAAGRWWDEGKNGRLLDEAAQWTDWPIEMAGALKGPNGSSAEITHAVALGEVNSAAMRQMMHSAGLFVSPSLYEPFGLAPLEAASAGLPLVLSDIPTYRELWDGAALFAPPDDPRKLAYVINQLAEAVALRHVMGLKAAARAQRFTLERQVARMAALYAAATQAAKAPRHEAVA